MCFYLFSQKLRNERIFLDLLLNQSKVLLKLQKILIILNIIEITKEQYDNYKLFRYCTILFRDLTRDKNFFIMNDAYIDPEKRYHFVKNSLYETKKDLRNIFCSFEIYGKYYKINFID